MKNHQKVTLSDVTYAYHTEGCGRPFIFLHGNGQNHHVFKRQIDYFKRFYHVLAVDSRGHGRSGWGRFSPTVSTIALDLHELIEKLHLSHCYVLGFSDGGNIALKLATLGEQDLDALIIISANLSPKALTRSFRYLLKGSSRFFHFWGRYMTWAERQGEKIDLALYPPDVSFKNLEHIQCPTLVIAGDNDIIDRQHTERIADHLPNSQLVILKNTGHNAVRQVPDRLNRIIHRFLKEIEQEEK